jgi:hypothetical protein
VTFYFRLLSLVPAAVAAGATPITWTLEGFTSLGTSIAGSFVFNADTDTYSDIDVVTRRKHNPRHNVDSDCQLR